MSQLPSDIACLISTAGATGDYAPRVRQNPRHHASVSAKIADMIVGIPEATLQAWATELHSNIWSSFGDSGDARMRMMTRGSYAAFCEIAGVPEQN